MYNTYALCTYIHRRDGDMISLSAQIKTTFLQKYLPCLTFQGLMSYFKMFILVINIDDCK